VRNHENVITKNSIFQPSLLSGLFPLRKFFSFHQQLLSIGPPSGVTRGGTGGTNPRAPKSPKNVTSRFFNTVHLLSEDLKFKHGGAKFAS